MRPIEATMSQPQARPSTRPERLLPDHFWMFNYKVAMCPLKQSHDWEKCIYAHDGEKARRRHPSKYQAVQCPEARAKKICPRGEDCPCTHHLFEYWLHPDRYMTCLCELGSSCNRPICFFAHHQAELRPLPDGLAHAANSSGSTRRRAAAAAAAAAAGASAGLEHPGSLPAGGGDAAAASTASADPLGRSRSPSTGGGFTGLRTPSTGSLSGAGTFAAGVMRSASGSSVLDTLLQEQQQQQGGLMSDVRPGFSALDALSASCAAQAAAAADGAALSTGTLAAAAALRADMAKQQQQQRLAASRSAATGTNACPSVLILEAPAPLPPGQDLPLAEAARQFSQLNLTAAGTGWVSPNGTLGPSTSTMSLASSTSSTMGITAMAGDPQGHMNPATTSALLLDAQQQLLRARSVSPATSPSYAGAGSAAAMMFAGGGAGSAGGSSRGVQQMQPGAFALLGPGGNVQLAAMQAAIEDPSEQLSFSLWDHTIPGGSANPAQAQQLAAIMGCSTLHSLEDFTGFSGRGSSTSSSVAMPRASAAPQVAQLANAAADRLLLAQQASQASASTAAASLAMAASPDRAVMTPRADTDKEARLTLLRAWMNAAAAAADGRARSTDGSQQHQHEQQLLQAAGAASVGGGAGPLSGRVGLLTARATRAVAQDMAAVMSPGDVASLVQQLQALLQALGPQQQQASLYL